MGSGWGVVGSDRIGGFEGREVVGVGLMGGGGGDDLSALLSGRGPQPVEPVESAAGCSGWWSVG